MTIVRGVHGANGLFSHVWENINCTPLCREFAHVCKFMVPLCRISGHAHFTFRNIHPSCNNWCYDPLFSGVYATHLVETFLSIFIERFIRAMIVHKPLYLRWSFHLSSLGGNHGFGSWLRKCNLSPEGWGVSSLEGWDSWLHVSFPEWFIDGWKSTVFGLYYKGGKLPRLMFDAQGDQFWWLLSSHTPQRYVISGVSFSFYVNFFLAGGYS